MSGGSRTVDGECFVSFTPPMPDANYSVNISCSKSGGKREGAGRKPSLPTLKKIPVGYKLPRWLVEWMRDQSESQSVLIEQALIEKHNLTAPKILAK